MKINKKIPWGMAIGTLGVTVAGIFNGTTALVTTLLARQQNEKKKLKPELMLELR